MSKRAKPVKKRKRTDWRFHFGAVLSELTRYRLICDWACQRIEKLEADAGKQQSEKRILLDTLFEVQAENIMQGEDILRQRDELIKLRGEPAERISL